ncbi:MAG: PAS domain S-box protein, partial [Sedimentisphaerales bacterium]|nr:PAS domain S-box protein [Sedimentisphaerales bacterium]
MIDSKRPPCWSVVLIYIAALVLSSWLIVRFGLPDSLLFVFVVPCVLLAFFYGRRVYLSMIVSLVVVPMVLADQLVGFLGFDAVHARRAWTDDDQALLRLIGETFANALERRRAEASLRESQALLDLFFTQSLDGFFFMMLDEPVCWDGAVDCTAVDKAQVLEYVFAHQRITRVNDAMLAQYGATQEQLLGRTPNDFFAHDSAYGKAVWRSFFDAGHLHVDTNMRKFDGTPMWVEGDYVCIYDAQGRIAGHFGVQREVTEQRRMVRALREQEYFLSALNDITRAALESSSLQDMLQILADRLGELFQADGCYLTLWDEEAQITVPGAAYGAWRDRYHQVRSEPGEATMTDVVLHAGHPLAAEDVHNTPYLSRRIAELFPDRSLLGLPLIAGERKLGAALVAYNDPHHFTEGEIVRGEQVAGQIALAVARAQALQAERAQRTRAEALNEELQASEKRYRTVSQLTSDFAAAYRVEPDGRAALEWLSGAFERITGYTPGQVEARGGIASIVHPDDVSGAQAQQRAIREGRSTESAFRIVTQSGEARWMHSYSYPDWDEAEKRPRGFYLAVQDITERKLAEEALIRASRLEATATLAG